MGTETRDKLQDLIKKNIIDVINCSDINDLITECYVNWKEDIIDAQKNRLTCLLHACNHRFLLPDENEKLTCYSTNYQKKKINVNECNNGAS